MPAWHPMTRRRGVAATSTNRPARPAFQAMCLRVSATVVQRVGSDIRCREMMTAHEAFVMKTPGSSRSIEDPVAADVEAYDRWVQHLIRSGQVRAEGGWFSIRLRRALPIALRVLGAWFK